MDTTPTPTPWTDLVAHATTKLDEEQRYHDACARAGRKPHGRRIDRRPLWVATLRLAEAFAKRPPQADLASRQDAWQWLCTTACRLTAEQDVFRAVINLAEILSRPPAERKEELARRAALLEMRAEEGRRRRAQLLRDELRRLDAQAPAPAGDNVVAFRTRGAA